MQLIDVEFDAGIDPLPPFTFCRPQAIVDQDAEVSIPNSSPFSRSTRFPFTSTASPPAPLAIRKAPSASVESIQPRPPQPSEVGRPKGRRRKNRRQSHTFFLSTCCAVPMIEAMIEAMIDVEIDAVIDPLPPFPFCCPQAIVDEEAGV